MAARTPVYCVYWSSITMVLAIYRINEYLSSKREDFNYQCQLSCCWYKCPKFNGKPVFTSYILHLPNVARSLDCLCVYCFVTAPRYSKFASRNEWKRRKYPNIGKLLNYCRSFHNILCLNNDSNISGQYDIAEHHKYKQSHSCNLITELYCPLIRFLY